MGKSKLGKLLFLMCTVDVIDYKYNIFIINLETWLWVYEFAQFAFAQFAHVVTLLDDC